MSLPATWTIKLLSEISEFITKGATPTTYGFGWVKTGIPFLRSECVAENGLNLQPAMRISQQAHYVLRRSAISDGDILMTITGNVGRVIRLPSGFGEGNINQHIARIRINDNNCNSLFVYYYLLQWKIRQSYYRILTGQAYPQISLEQVRDTKIILPPLPEQRKIAEILSTWDDAIEKLDQLIEKKKLLKKGLMQQLLTGKRRFPGFTEPWREVRLGEVVDLRFSNVDKKSVVGETAVKLCNYMDVYRNQTIHGRIPFMTATASESQIRNFRLAKGDLLFTKDSETPDDIAVPSVVEEDLDHVICGYHLALARPNPALVNGFFLAQLFRHQKYRNEFSRMANGAVRYGLNLSEAKKITLMIPMIDEQDRIASALSLIDLEISAINSKLDLLQQQKRGLMQQLLTGKIRVKT